MAHIQQPDFCRELTLLSQGYHFIAGIDEAGRGAWAGPVVAAACILPLDDPALLRKLGQVRDSKLLSARQRDQCYDAVTACALSWAAQAASAEEIDQLGILPATRLAMQRAVAALELCPDLLMIDAVRLQEVAIPQIVEFKADRNYLSTAAASIIAKVTRDRLMAAMERELPGYGFSSHKGYGTARHRAALRELGISREHRLSYRPIHDLLAPQNVERKERCQNCPIWK